MNSESDGGADSLAAGIGNSSVPYSKEPPRRLRRLHRVWPDRDGNISYLLTLCVEGRAWVLHNEVVFNRLVAFLLDSPSRYRWFGRRFVIMPDHIHIIAHMGYEATRLGQWVKALKAVVGGLERKEECQVRDACLQHEEERRVAAPGLEETLGRRVGAPGLQHRFQRVAREWRWQEGFHDHKLRTRESEARKWEYVCLNPVRYHLVARREDWPYGGEVFYGGPGGPELVRGTPPLLESGILIEEDGTFYGRQKRNAG